MNIRKKIDDRLYSVEKPERYIGNEWNQIKKNWSDDKTKIVLSFPDVYEIGMSHLGLKILYHKLNSAEDIICERVYAPWIDLEELLCQEKLPLFSLESGRAITDFDIIGFTLQYELSYTNIVNMLSLAHIPVFSKDRTAADPFVIGGGSTVYNPEPVAPFFDLLFIGEAEEKINELVRSISRLKKQRLSRKEILEELNQKAGVYCPALYDFSYDNQGAVTSFDMSPGIKKEIKKQIVSDFDQSFYPVDFLVPYMNIVHNRAVLEIARGCTRSCRFCAAGISYRPVREKKMETLVELADKILASTGYGELSLNSLSTVDYSRISELVNLLANRYQDQQISISLPSLRIDEFSVQLAQQVQKVRKSGLTFAPEAGTDRLRRVINKYVEEKDLYNAVEAAFSSGWRRIKLYFMIGLPTEKEEDLQGIINMVKKSRDLGRKFAGNRTRVEVSVSTFIPKPFTPFQWVPMVDKDIIEQKQSFLRKHISGRGLNLSWNNPRVSLLEAVFARGDRRLARVIYSAWKKGARFDGWDDQFDFTIWEKAFSENNISLKSFLTGFSLEDKLPWQHINMGVLPEFLKKEYKKALREEFSDDCREGKCYGCGISMFYPEVEDSVNQS